MAKKNQPDIRLSVSVKPATDAALRVAAATKRMSKTKYVSALLDSHLKVQAV